VFLKLAVPWDDRTQILCILDTWLTPQMTQKTHMAKLLLMTIVWVTVVLLSMYWTSS